MYSCSIHSVLIYLQFTQGESESLGKGSCICCETRHRDSHVCIDFHYLVLIRRELIRPSRMEKGTNKRNLRKAPRTTYLFVRIPQHALPCFSASVAYFTYPLYFTNSRLLGEVFLQETIQSRPYRIYFRA